ncbi:MAG TPA: C4-dicarboxylate ABC transporter permease [Rhodobacteraceae bacterium]|jgi:TRAP-type mannitol/chloroaromatic compound transport system permease small subunit|nr:TRAP transporter small permease subunit [Paracoccaceae bacterium]HBG99677.1 C4-dicarboxylate ABC transporter permease [Paracoccaceae bacterium]
MLTGLRIAGLLTRICDYAARFAALVMLGLVFVIVYDVIGRKFFATGSFMLQELEWHMNGIVATFAFGYAYTRNAHVRIDVLAGRIPERARLWLEFGAVVFLVIPFLALIAWYGYEFAERAFERGEGANGGRGLPHRWVIKSAVPVAAILTIMGCAAVAIRIYAVLTRPDLIASPFIERGLWKR